MPGKGFFELYPEFRPILKAGPHMLAADHDLVAAPPHNDPGDLAVDGTDFTFRIISPRYTMPPDQILSTFPPATAVGDWRDRLPQIVFKRRTLPWEREPDHDHVFPAPQPPWFALVVLADGEFTLSSAGIPVDQCVTSGTHMPDDTDIDTAAGRYLEVRESIVSTIFPTVDDLRLLSHVRKVSLDDTELALGDDDGYLAVTIANRLPQPGPPAEPGGPRTSMKYTACLINLESQLGVLPTKETTESDFVFTMVMPELVESMYFVESPDLPIDVVAMQGIGQQFIANKALAQGARARQFEVAKSVGVEQAASAYATGPAATQATSGNDTYAATVWADGSTLGQVAELWPGAALFVEHRFRFPVLASWEFVCTAEGGFERLMNALDSGLLGTDEISVDPRLRADLPPIDPALRPEVAATGHVGLEHRTRRGEAARSWYRGPLVPQPTQRVAPASDGTLPLAHTGDQLRRVVPDGREDVGLAAAFEIGRLLALSQPGIVAGMMAWREELFGASRVHQLSSHFFDEIVSGFSAATLDGRSALEGLIADTMIIGYASHIGESLGAPAKAFPVSRLPEVVESSTSASVLTGLGLDAGQVKARTKEFGAAGMATFQPAVAAMPDGPLSQGKDLAAVRTVLAAHVDRIATEALKLAGPPNNERPNNDRPGKATRKRTARPPKDALDRFIEQAESTHPEEEQR
jgi:hypothetical protein